MRPDRARRCRVLLLALAATGVTPGLWALLAPAAFHAGFPGGGLTWVADLGPYDEHLVRDVGAAFVALTVLALLAAARPHRELVRATATTWLVFLVLHLGVHLRVGDARGPSAAAQLVVLAVQLVLPVLLLHAARGGAVPTAGGPGGTALR